MKKIGCITYDEARVDKSVFTDTNMEILKDFFNNEYTQEDIKKNNFNQIFLSWGAINPFYLNNLLIKFLLLAGIDFLPYMDVIPPGFFENCIYIEKIEIPNNINRIGIGNASISEGPVFGWTNIKEIKIKARNNKLFIGDFAFDHIDTIEGIRMGNKTSFIFEGTKEEFYDKIQSKSFGIEVEFKCSDGVVRI